MNCSDVLHSQSVYKVYYKIISVLREREKDSYISISRIDIYIQYYTLPRDSFSQVFNNVQYYRKKSKAVRYTYIYSTQIYTYIQSSDSCSSWPLRAVTVPLERNCSAPDSTSLSLSLAISAPITRADAYRFLSASEESCVRADFSRRRAVQRLYLSAYIRIHLLRTLIQLIAYCVGMSLLSNWLVCVCVQREREREDFGESWFSQIFITRRYKF